MFDRQTAPSEEIDVAEEAHVAWIRSQRDASLWHQATMAALAHRSDPHDFIPWVLTQPELDRATAGWLFLWSEGSRYLRGERDFPHYNVSSERMLAQPSVQVRRSSYTVIARRIAPGPGHAP